MQSGGDFLCSVYADRVGGKTKYHVCVGHSTVLAEASFFGLEDGRGMGQQGACVLSMG